MYAYETLEEDRGARAGQIPLRKKDERSTAYHPETKSWKKHSIEFKFFLPLSQIAKVLNSTNQTNRKTVQFMGMQIWICISCLHTHIHN